MKIHFVSSNRRSSITFLAALVLLPGCLLLAQATSPLAQPGKYRLKRKASWFFEITRVLVRFDHVAGCLTQ
jgi:hypothetical protein